MSSVAEVLRAAEQVIGERGWCQGSYEFGGQVCVKGAINLTVWGGIWYDDVSDEDFELANVANDAVTDVVGMSAIYWNDRPERTEAEVRAALLAAAQRAESGGVTP